MDPMGQVLLMHAPALGAVLPPQWVYNIIPHQTGSAVQGKTLVSAIDPANLWPAAGQYARLTIEFITLPAAATAVVWFGQGGSGEDFTGNQINVTFSGNGTITGDGVTLTYVSDWVFLGELYDDTVKYSMAVEFVSGSAITLAENNIVSVSTGNIVYLKNAADAATTNKSGYTSTSNITSLLRMLEIADTIAPAQGIEWVFRGSAEDATNLSTYSFASSAIGTAAADRRVHVGVSGGALTRTISSVTIGGVTATRNIELLVGATTAAIFTTIVPSGTTATIDVVWSGGQERCAVAWWTSTGVILDAALSTDGANNPDGAGFDIDVDLTDTSSRGFIIVYATHFNSTASTVPRMLPAYLKGRFETVIEGNVRHYAGDGPSTGGTADIRTENVIGFNSGNSPLVAAAFHGPAILTIFATPVTTTVIDVAYAGFTATASYGVTPYTFSVAAGTLPTGLSLNASTGAITGTATSAGTSSGIVLRVTDAVGRTDDTGPFAITVQYMLDSTTITSAYSFSRVIKAGASTLYTDTSGAIDTWVDQSGNSRTLSQTSTARPTISTAGPNSKACGDFDGTNDYLASSADFTTFVNTTTAYFAISFIADSITANNANPYDNDPVFGCANAAFGLNLKDAGTPKTAQVNNYDGNHDVAQTAAINTATAYVVECWHDSNVLYVCVNGGTPVSTASGTGQFYSGNVLNVGRAYTSNAKFHNGKIFEFVSASTIPANRTAIVANMMAWIGA